MRNKLVVRLGKSFFFIKKKRSCQDRFLIGLLKVFNGGNTGTTSNNKKEGEEKKKKRRGKSYLIVRRPTSHCLGNPPRFQAK